MIIEDGGRPCVCLVEPLLQIVQKVIQKKMDNPFIDIRSHSVKNTNKSINSFLNSKYYDELIIYDILIRVYIIFATLSQKDFRLLFSRRSFSTPNVE